MGGYAAINYSHKLSLRLVVVLSPQFSIARDKTPWETRWTKESNEIRWVEDRIADVQPISGFVGYDPYLESLDRRHVQEIQLRHNLVDLCIPFSGHHPLEFISGCGNISEIMPRLLFDLPDRGRFIYDRRRLRRKSAVYWSNMSIFLLDRGNIDAAVNAALRAQHSQGGNRTLIEHNVAEALYAAGDRSKALDLWRNALKVRDQTFEERQWRIEQSASKRQWPSLLIELL